jgi:peptidoglycan-associated lipoprotein
MKFSLPRTILLATILLLSLSGCTRYYISQGNKNFDALAYYKAAQFYEKAVAKKQDPKALTNLAVCYRSMNEYKKAEDTYAKVVVLPNADPMHTLSYAKILMNNGKTEQAAEQLKNYLKLKPTDSNAEMLLRSLNERNTMMKDTTQWSLTPVKMGGIQEFFSPVRYKDGYIFSATGEAPKTEANPSTGKGYYDLYFVKQDASGNFGTPAKLEGHINGKLHDGMAAVVPGGNEIYYTTTNDEGLNEEERYEKVIGLKIQKDVMKDGKWEKAEDFPHNSRDYSTGHPTLTYDGKTMYFISDKPGGSGGTDIYSTKLVNGAWSAPENLGSLINTPENEMFPYVDSLGNLYFSSFGHKTMGGLDVFVCKNEMGKLSPPENLNYPLNSSKDDFSFSIDNNGTRGYVSSNRSGTDKIYSFTKNPAKIEVTGKVSSKIDGKPLANVKIDISDKMGGSTVTVYTDEAGNYKAMLESEKEFEFSVAKDGYFAQTAAVSTKGKKDNLKQDFVLDELVIDKPVVIDQSEDPNKPRPIFFDFDKWDIRPDAYENLNKLVKLLKDNPKVNIELSSHTDCRGTDSYNQKLSERRAKATAKYLTEKGIKSKRIKSKGYGERKLVNKCADGVPCSTEEHQENRRTEFKVISVDK